MAIDSITLRMGVFLVRLLVMATIHLVRGIIIICLYDVELFKWDLKGLVRAKELQCT
jgi:hypothetical protein